MRLSFLLMMFFTMLIVALYTLNGVDGTPMWSVFSYAPETRKGITRRPDVMLNGRAQLTTTSTSQYDGMPDKCRFHGWFYCFSDQQCHLSKSEAKDCLFKCVNIHGDTMCSAYGCIYDYAKKKCGGQFRKGKFAVNVCGDSTTDSDGHWYKSDASNRACYERPKPHVYPKSMNAQDYPLYRKQQENTNVITVNIPIYEDGKYTLRVRIGECYWVQAGKRVLKGTLSNGTDSFPIFSNVLATKNSIAKNDPPDAVDQFVEIAVENDARMIVWNGQKMRISSYQFTLQIFKDKVNGNTHPHAILNAVLLLQH